MGRRRLGTPPPWQRAGPCLRPGYGQVLRLYGLHTTRARPGASLAGSWRSRRGASGRRSASGQLHCPELLGPCPGDAGLSIVFGLKIHRSLLVAAIRMAVQLTLVGLVLTALFSLVSPLWTGIAV